MKHDGAVVGCRGCCAVLTRFCQGAVVVLGVKIQACNNCKYIISLCMTITIQLYLYYVKLRNSITSTLVHNKTVQNTLYFIIKDKLILNNFMCCC